MNSHIAYIYTFITIAVLILCISLINYMNLSTARALTRAREVGVRKAVGAQRAQIFLQFTGESILLSCLAFCLALLIVEFGLTYFNTIIVIGDFHFESLYHTIEPLVLHIEPTWYRYLSLKVSTEQLADTIRHIEAVWNGFSPSYPFEYFFLDERIERLYDREQQLNAVVGSFSLLALGIACLGLFGLASHTTAQRTREIGVRKVLGASVVGIILLLSRGFVKLVVFANLIAWPVMYYAMRTWLNNFPYRVEQEIATFVISGLLAIGIALVTVGWQATRAARTNPVDTLRYD